MTVEKESYKLILDKFIADYKKKHHLSDEDERYVRSELGNWDLERYADALYWLGEHKKEKVRLTAELEQRFHIKEQQKALQRERRKIFSRIKELARFRVYAQVYKMGIYENGRGKRKCKRRRKSRRD